MISLTSLALLPELAAVVEEAAAAALDKADVEAVVPVISESWVWTAARAVSTVAIAEVTAVTCSFRLVFSVSVQVREPAPEISLDKVATLVEDGESEAMVTSVFDLLMTSVHDVAVALVFLPLLLDAKLLILVLALPMAALLALRSPALARSLVDEEEQVEMREPASSSNFLQVLKAEVQFFRAAAMALASVDALQLFMALTVVLRESAVQHAQARAEVVLLAPKDFIKQDSAAVLKVFVRLSHSLRKVMLG